MQSEVKEANDENKNVENHNMSDQSQQDRVTDLNNSRQDKLEAPKKENERQN